MRDSCEVASAIAGGADIIDAKEPTNGAIGPVTTKTLRSIATSIQNRAPLSVALGELKDLYQTNTHDDFLETAISLANYVKVGLADVNQCINWLDHLDALSTRTKTHNCQLVLVAYADWNCTSPQHETNNTPATRSGQNQNAGSNISPEHALEIAATLDAALLIDTANKNGNCLSDHLHPTQLEKLLTHATSLQVPVSLAGSLRGKSFRQAATLATSPTLAVLGVRGAACTDHQRNSAINQEKVRELKSIIEAHNTLLATSAIHAGG